MNNEEASKKASLDEMHDLIGHLYRKFDRMSGTPIGRKIEENLGIPITRMYLTDLLEYYAYLAASDGDITIEEVQAINDLCDCSTTVADIQKQVFTYDLCGDKYLKATPHILDIAMLLDDRAIKIGFQDKAELTLELLNVYRISGLYYIKRTNAFTDKEKTWRSYIFARGMYAGRKFDIDFSI